MKTLFDILRRGERPYQRHNWPKSSLLPLLRASGALR